MLGKETETKRGRDRESGGVWWFRGDRGVDLTPDQTSKQVG